MRLYLPVSPSLTSSFNVPPAANPETAVRSGHCAPVCQSAVTVIRMSLTESVIFSPDARSDTAALISDALFWSPYAFRQTPPAAMAKADRLRTILREYHNLREMKTKKISCGSYPRPAASQYDTGPWPGMYGALLFHGSRWLYIARRPGKAASQCRHSSSGNQESLWYFHGILWNLYGIFL